MKEYEIVFQLSFQNSMFVQADDQQEVVEMLTDNVFQDYKVVFDGEYLEFDDVSVLEVSEVE